jgi:hypothetical protein
MFNKNRIIARMEVGEVVRLTHPSFPLGMAQWFSTYVSTHDGVVVGFGP